MNYDLVYFKGFYKTRKIIFIYYTLSIYLI